MATGFEVAGLVLGLFPIVIEGLKSCINSADTVKEMKRYKFTLDQFRRDINMEECIFNNTWDALMIIAGMDPTTIRKQPWSAGVENKLLSCLPSSSVESFVAGCQDLHNILAELAQKFIKYEKDKAGYLKMLRVLRDFTKEYREAQKERIHRLNSNLDKLVNGTPPVVNAQLRRNKSSQVSYSNRVRKHAMMLYSILREKLQAPTCPCKVPHSTNLQLETRFSRAQKDSSEDYDSIPFNLIFPINTYQDKTIEVSAWRELQFEHLDTSIEAFPDYASTGQGKVQVCSKPILTLEFAAEMTTTRTDDNLPRSTIQDPTSSLDGMNCEKIVPDRLIKTSIRSKVSKRVSFLKPTRSRASRARSPGPMPDPSDSTYPASRPRSPSHMLDPSDSSCPPRRPQSPRSPRSPILDPSDNPQESATRGPKRGAFKLPSGGCLNDTYKENPLTLAGRIINCFCSTIRNASEDNPHLGLLISTDNKKHRVWIPRQPLSISKPARTVTLGDLLSMRTPSRKERLKLGVKLASSVMQLHKTQWLSEKWSKQDILFIQECSSQSNVPVLENPLVPQTFTPDSSPCQISAEFRFTRCNRSLYSLGIILIELWFWRSLESFQAENGSKQPNSVTTETEEYSTALRVLDDKLYGDAGDNFGDIVRRCITGLDHRETQLESDDFKNEVYGKIIQPLEEHLQGFWDASLDTIFEK